MTEMVKSKLLDGLAIGLVLGMLLMAAVLNSVHHHKIAQIYKDNICLPHATGHEYIGVHVWCEYEMPGCYDGFKNWSKGSLIRIVGSSEASPLNMAKDDIVLVGDFTWQEARAMVIELLEKCRTEEEFTQAILKISTGIGTAEQIIETRKRLGIETDSLKQQLKDKGALSS